MTRVFVPRASNPVERMAARLVPLGPIRISRAMTGSALRAPRIIQLMHSVQFQTLLVMKRCPKRAVAVAVGICRAQHRSRPFLSTFPLDKFQPLKIQRHFVHSSLQLGSVREKWDLKCASTTCIQTCTRQVQYMSA